MAKKKSKLSPGKAKKKPNPAPSQQSDLPQDVDAMERDEHEEPQSPIICLGFVSPNTAKFSSESSKRGYVSSADSKTKVTVAGVSKIERYRMVLKAKSLSCHRL